MIDDVKKTYEDYASTYISGWENKSRSELLSGCVDNISNNLLYQAYLSALICKCWYLIPRYAQIDSQFASAEDVYEWLIESIQYTIDQRKWLDENSPLFGDEKGPVKALMTVFRCRRFTAYQSSNRQKRKINAELYSIDGISEEAHDDMYQIMSVENNDNSQEVIATEHQKYLVKKYFDRKEYFTSFLLYGIMYGDVFQYIEQKERKHPYLMLDKLRVFLRGMNDVDIDMFADLFGIDRKEAVHASTYVTSISDAKMKSKIPNTLKALSLDGDIRELLC